VTEPDRRRVVAPDRRRGARGGRRESDRPGRYPVILLADSYDDARSPVARYLDRFGFEVREATSADEAVEALDRHRPDVVLSGLRGQQATALFDALSARRGGRPAVVMVLLSATDDPVPAAATGVLTKPFSLRPMLDELRREIRAASERHRSES
jgi:DNA-binding NtrC family response regulator